jgi:pilus assembly protein CpaF
MPNTRPSDTYSRAPVVPDREANAQAATFNAVRERVQRRLLEELKLDVDVENVQQVRPTLERIFAETLAEEQMPLTRVERNQMLQDVEAEIFGFGSIEPLLRDETITEILINGCNQVYVERKGLLTETNVHFRDNEELMRVIHRIVAPLGRRVDESSPMVDARLPDGSRVNVIIPPLALAGPCVSIRKFSRGVLSAEDAIRLSTLTKEMSDFLKASVLARLNIVVSGGTSSGKTTFLNMLSTYVPANERVVTIEDAAELRLTQRHVVRLEARPPNTEGRGQITIRQLVINALRMRPDRIIVGEVRGGEALDMLQAMNTGHDGSLTTAHSNGPRDTLRRVETMVMMAGTEMPLQAIREQVSSAFDLIVHLERVSDGSRKVVQIAEVQGMEGDTIVLQDVFRYQQQGTRDGRVEGFFTASGVRPRVMDKIAASGIALAPNMFVPTPPPARHAH